MTDFLAIRNLSRHFGGHRVVQEVGFIVDAGSLMALIGPNGAGKTTLFNMVAGALPPTAGSVHFHGQRIASPMQACHLGIARTFQNVRLFTRLSVLDNVLTGMAKPDFWRSSFRFARQLEEERLRMKKASYLLEEMGIFHLADQPAGEIPFGQQRLVEIARAMALQPKLILLDEPAAGLNRTETAHLAGLIRRIHSQGVTVLLVEHDMHLVMNLAQRVLVLDQGRLIADGTPKQVQTSAVVQTAYLGVEIDPTHFSKG